MLDEADLDDEEEYTLTDSMILLKGEFDLSQDENEEAIRTELCSLFQTKYPYITNKDFDFVKRERNKISRPVTKKGHTWGFDHVKHLCGTGKLYVRLNIAKETLNEDEDDEGMYQVVRKKTIYRLRHCLLGSAPLNWRGGDFLFFLSCILYIFSKSSQLRYLFAKLEFFGWHF